MTRNEYMKRLTNALSDVNPSIKDEIINDYEEHFDIGLKDGKTEDMICHELGDIDEILSELNNEKVAHYDSTSTDASTNSKTDGNEIDSAQIDLLFGEIEIKKSPSNKFAFTFQIEGTEEDKKSYIVEDNRVGNTMTINVKKIKTKTNLLSLFKNRSYPNIKLSVELPDNFSSLSIKCSSGKLDVSSVNIDKCDLKLTNGHIKLFDSSIKNCSAYNVNGQISMTGRFNDLSVGLTNGNIDILNEAKTISHVKTINGDLFYKLGAAGGFDATVSSSTSRPVINSKNYSSSREGRHRYGNGENILHLNTTCGHLDFTYFA